MAMSYPVGPTGAGGALCSQSHVDHLSPEQGLVVSKRYEHAPFLLNETQYSPHWCIMDLVISGVTPLIVVHEDE